VLAVTARLFVEIPSAELEAGVGAPDPTSGAGEEAGAWSGAAVTGFGTLAVGCEGVGVISGDGRACDDVQPASVTNASTAGPMSRVLAVMGQRARSPGRIVDLTNLLWSWHLTNV
jgi:hypothetical protein